MSYQPEERYWTDYLRIALPVVGLLLMLGLFWFWAASLIGDEDDNDPANVAALATNTPVPTAVPPTETPPPGGNGAANADGSESAPSAGAEDETVNDDSTIADSNGESTDGSDEDTNSTTDDEAAAEDDPSGFNDGELVATISDGVRLRSSPETVDDNIIDTFASDVEFVVTGPSEEDEDGSVWIPVELGEDPDVAGYISDTLLATSE